jgi:hypothetical protein
MDLMTKQEEDNLSPFWSVRREVKRLIPDADPAVIDASAAATMAWWFRAFALVGEAYGTKDNLVIPRDCFNRWVQKYGL